jgi:hypothetical protein
MNARTKVSIACASGFWGDSPLAVPQVLTEKNLDYIVFDYLSEVTLTILARIKKREPEKGYIQDFMTDVIEPHLEKILERKIRLIANAGALNPLGLKKAIEDFAATRGLSVKVAAVHGDDLKLTHLVPSVVKDLDGKEWKSSQFITTNAYLGAPAIVKALSENADIVVTGRIVDTALVTAPAMYELKKDFSDYAFLAQASLAGHIVECGCQCTGGNFTDWNTVPQMDNVGYPIVRMLEDGSFEITKPPGTGGVITPASVSEQIVYEIGDPANYVLPDVICDFTQVTVTQKDPETVLVRGAKGKLPTSTYKVSATVALDHKIHATAFIKGGDARTKAQKTGEAILKKVSRALEEKKLAPFTNTLMETLGGNEECLLRLSAVHADVQALDILSKEIAPGATGLAPGMTNILGGRASPVPRVKLVSFLVPKKDVVISVNDQRLPASAETAGNAGKAEDTQGDSLKGPFKKIKLEQIAYARSGDKGDDVNIGVLARNHRHANVLRSVLTKEKVRDFFSAEFNEPGKMIVHRWELPGLNAFNFLIKNCLGGGGASSLKIDPQGKAWAQRLLQMEIEVPENM